MVEKTIKKPMCTIEPCALEKHEDGTSLWKPAISWIEPETWWNKSDRAFENFDTGLFYCLSHWKYLGGMEAVEVHFADKGRFGTWRKKIEHRRKAAMHNKKKKGTDGSNQKG